VQDIIGTRRNIVAGVLPEPYFTSVIECLSNLLSPIHLQLTIVGNMMDCHERFD
jgi:hypothetical protein